MRNYFYTVLLFFLSVNSISQTSPFNNLEVKSDSTGKYHYLISAHFYGDGTNKSHFPANTLLANLEWINQGSHTMLVCLGDLFMDIKNDRTNYQSSLFDKLEVPLFNSVGNHDLTDKIYQENYGETYYSFRLHNDLHIVVDTELDDGNISGEQLEFLSQRLNTEGISNFFIYGHRTIWKDSYDALDGLFSDNTQSITEPNYKSEVLPLVQEASKRANVFWFAGSLGPAPASFFHYPDPDYNIQYVATAIRSLPRDAMLEVISDNGKVTFQTHSLTGEDLQELEAYDVEFWQSEVGEEPFNWRLVPLYFKLMLTHRYFWYGIAFAFGGIMALRFIRRRRARD